MEKEKRIYKDKAHHLRAVTEEETRYIEGYAIVFDHESKLIIEKEGEFREVIRSGAVDDVLSSPELNVIATYNHSKDMILGRYNAKTGQRTLNLSIDDKGLKYRIKVPDTNTGNEVYELVERGDLYESSFVFAVRSEDQEWDFNGKIDKRYVNKIARLFDVSVVFEGSYSDTDVNTAKRHCTEARKLIEDKPDEAKVTNAIDEMDIKLHELNG